MCPTTRSVASGNLQNKSTICTKTPAAREGSAQTKQRQSRPSAVTSQHRTLSAGLLQPVSLCSEEEENVSVLRKNLDANQQLSPLKPESRQKVGRKLHKLLVGGSELNPHTHTPAPHRSVIDRLSTGTHHGIDHLRPLKAFREQAVKRDCK